MPEYRYCCKKRMKIIRKKKCFERIDSPREFIDKQWTEYTYLCKICRKEKIFEGEWRSSGSDFRSMSQPDGQPTVVIGREGGEFYRFPGICNYAGNPEIDETGKCRYMEIIGNKIEGGHEKIDRKKRCRWCGAATVINDAGMTWCISNCCSWRKK